MSHRWDPRRRDFVAAASFNPNAAGDLSADTNAVEEWHRQQALVYKPFSQIHFCDSVSDIVTNQIRLNKDAVYTNVKAIYTVRGKNANRESSVTVHADTDINPSDQKTAIIATDLDCTPFGDDVVSRFASWLLDIIGLPGTDADLLNLVSRAFMTHPAYHFAVNTLADFLRHMYDGELILLGDPAIKPYDFIILMDFHNAMNGPIQVREVVHSFLTPQGSSPR